MLKRRWRFALLLTAVAIAPSPLLAQTPPHAASAPPAQAQADAKDEAAQKAAQAKAEREKQAKAKRDQLMGKCQIKPVMSDDDIANCRAAYAAN